MADLREISSGEFARNMTFLETLVRKIRRERLPSFWTRLTVNSGSPGKWLSFLAHLGT